MRRIDGKSDNETTRLLVLSKSPKAELEPKAGNLALFSRLAGTPEVARREAAAHTWHRLPVRLRQPLTQRVLRQPSHHHEDARAPLRRRRCLDRAEPLRCEIHQTPKPNDAVRTVPPNGFQPGPTPGSASSAAVMPGRFCGRSVRARHPSGRGTSNLADRRCNWPGTGLFGRPAPASSRAVGRAGVW